MLQDPNVGVTEVAAVIAKDAPLAAKVLRIANSPYYGLRESCMSTQQASAVLGLRVLRNVVLQASVIRHYDALKATGFDVEGLWKRSIVSGQACTFIARRCKRPLELKADDLYICGLLEDLGQFVLLDSLKQSYVALAARSISENLPIHVVEQEALGYDHADVGHKIAQRWNLPPHVINAIGFHHGPESQIGTSPVVGLVARTSLLVHHVFAGHTAATDSVFTPDSMNLLGITAQDIADVRNFVVETKSTVEI
jgi:HD-like signal output (HDOD) protein